MQKRKSSSSRPGSSKKSRKGSYAPASSVPRRMASKTYSRPKFGEIKGVDTTIALSPVLATMGSNGSIFVPNLVAPGSGSYNRVGRKIMSRSLRIKASLEYLCTQVAATGDISGAYCRMIVLWDKQPQGVLPAFNTVFAVTGQDGTETETLLAPLKYDQMDRYKVLLDKVYNFNIPAGGPANGDNNTVVQTVDEYLRLNNLETVFSAQNSPAGIADIASGGLYIIFRASVNTVGTGVVSVGQYSICRLRYTD